MINKDSGNGAASGKRVFGWVEVVFDAAYLTAALAIGIILILPNQSNMRNLAGITALVLAGGDAFHLIPRMMAVVTSGERRFKWVLGIGKFITSITMTLFYLLLWHIGVMVFNPDGTAVFTALMYILGMVRIALCFFPQNKWTDEAPPVNWGIYRNIPFVLMGMMTAILFGINAGRLVDLSGMWVAIVLSFLFYLPVVLWAGKNRKLGMLMLPKSCAYLWILVMCLNSLK